MARTVKNRIKRNKTKKNVASPRSSRIHDMLSTDFVDQSIHQFKQIKKSLPQLDQLKNKKHNFFNTTFGKAHALQAAERGQRGTPQAGPYGKSMAVIATYLPTLL